MKVLCILLCVAFTNGFYIDNNETHEEKIVGGGYFRVVDVSYQASLLWMRVNNICGATIIHKSWVVTAGHCVHKKSLISVRTGSEFRYTLGQVHRVQKIIKHADFEPNNKNNDIALIKLVVPIQFNKEQQPIELAKPHYIPRKGQSLRISGFGKIGLSSYPSQRKAAYIPVRNQESCQKAYRPFIITDNMFCAGIGDFDACYGDSGGPGVIRSKLYGIISFGVNCTSTLYPEVFTKVHKYYDWIEEKTGLKF